MKKANRFAKKVLALFSSACVLLMCFSALGTVAFADDDISGESQSVTEPETEASESSETSTPTTVWQGGEKRTFSGEGTAANPYQISTPDELYGLAKNIISGSVGNHYSGVYFILTNDIYLNDVNQKNWTQNSPNTWIDWWSGVRAFAGNFDGQGHTIYGIYYSESYSSRNAGLFGTINGAKISNLHIRNSVIRTTKDYAGAIAGENYWLEGYTEKLGPSIISGCSVDDSVIIKANIGAGGLIGYSRYSAHFRNCYSTAQISGLQETTYVYGIYGQTNSPYTNSLYKCYSNLIPGYYKTTDKPYCVNVYTTEDPTIGTITKVTALTKANMKALDYTNIWTAADDSSAPTLVTKRHNGDVNLDGSANAADITALKKQLLGVANTYSANVNRDNVVDICDLVQLKIYLK